ncbi:hypothetical protein PC9H_005627 [Pleurotus ostreatus]|uniref:Uncharacterized protein n=1 Tax=Pleurotus ostreatus TaxID=5322 RepID=A0A8H6ZWU2_PLEOS|nr:uncharacterized protein PC9H_005627 [Pleurotus ostreatus]KAF7433665.1 hypothetical protein PC9H_005627 [Pleurotus ostreatus]
MLPSIATLIAFYHTFLLMTTSHSAKYLNKLIGSPDLERNDAGVDNKDKDIRERAQTWLGFDMGGNEVPAFARYEKGEDQTPNVSLKPSVSAAESGDKSGSARSQLCVPFNTPTKPVKSYLGDRSSSSPIPTPSPPSLNQSWDSSLMSPSHSLEQSFSDDYESSPTTCTPYKSTREVGLGIQGLSKKTGDIFDGLGILSLHGHRVSASVAVAQENDTEQTMGGILDANGLSEEALEQFYESFTTDPFHLRSLSPISEANDELDLPSFNTDNGDKRDVFLTSYTPSRIPIKSSPRKARTDFSERPRTPVSLPRAGRSFRRLTRDLSTPTVSSHLKSSQRRHSSMISQPSWRI